jgi:glycosidase
MNVVPLSPLLTSTPQSLYHGYCPIVWGERDSEMNCWMGDEKVPLPDLNTQNPQVQTGYGDWIENLVKEYSIDGLRIDGMCLTFLFVVLQSQLFFSCKTCEQ